MNGSSFRDARATSLVPCQPVAGRQQHVRSQRCQGLRIYVVGKSDRIGEGQFEAACPQAFDELALGTLVECDPHPPVTILELADEGRHVSRGQGQEGADAEIARHGLAGSACLGLQVVRLANELARFADDCAAGRG